MYISHDEILGSFYRALGWDHVKGALPASTLYFEFYKTKPAKEERFLREGKFLGDATSGYKVRVFFNDTAGQPGQQVFLYSSDKKSQISTLEDFRDLIQDQLKTYQFPGLNVRDVCQNTSFKFKQDFYSPDTWKQEMSKIYVALNAMLTNASFVTLSLIASLLAFY
jgi:hypothetical protein